MGNGRVLLISLIHGTVSSASTTAAAAKSRCTWKHYRLQGASATVLRSITSTAMSLPIVRQHIKSKAIIRDMIVATILQGLAGVAVLVAEYLFLR
jgi:hypothetical protein